MDKLEELKAKLHCQECHRRYNEFSTRYIYERCQHHCCGSCMIKRAHYRNTCHFCGIRSDYKNFPFPEDASIALEIHESMVEKSAEVERKLQNEISDLKQERTASELVRAVQDKVEKKLKHEISILKQDNAKREQASATKENELRDEILVLKQKQTELEALREHHHECGECGGSESEQSMQLCQTCHTSQFKNLEDVKKNALCSACAIRKHIRQGHQTVDFFPYLSAFNFSSHSSQVKLESKQLKDAENALDKAVSDLKALSTNFSESYDKLTDMARRSKSTKSQLVLIEKMKAFSCESKSIHVEATLELNKQAKLLQESLTKIKTWCNAKINDCLDESEVIELDTAKGSTENNKSNKKKTRKRAHP